MQRSTRRCHYNNLDKCIYVYLYLSIGLSIMLAILWVVGAVAFKNRGINLEVVKDKSFWISAGALFAVVITVVFICIYSTERKNTIDENLFFKTIDGMGRV